MFLPLSLLSHLHPLRFSTQKRKENEKQSALHRYRYKYMPTQVHTKTGMGSMFARSLSASFSYLCSRFMRADTCRVVGFEARVPALWRWVVWCRVV